MPELSNSKSHPDQKLYPPNPPAESLFESYKNMVFRLGLVRTRSAQDADDIVQEVFVRYLRHKPQFDSQSHEKAWFIRTAINYTGDLLRARARRGEMPKQDTGADDPRLAEAGEGVMHQILELCEEQRVAIHLHYYEGYKVEEIAELTGVTASAVKSRLMRGRQNLRRSIEQEQTDQREEIAL